MDVHILLKVSSLWLYVPTYFIFGQLSEFAVGKPLLVNMDDGLAIITLFVGACQDLPPLVHRENAGQGWMDKLLDRSIGFHGN